MNLYPQFAGALPMKAFLEKYGHAGRWQATFEKVRLTEDQTKLLASFKREMNVLVLAGAWCGDCSGQCPIFDKFAEISPLIRVRYLDNADHPAVQDELMINGGKRVPVAVFFSEDGFEVSRFGERPLSTYRRMARDLDGDSCSTGLVTSGDSFSLLIQDWLEQFERVQYLLRLSSRLRQKHGD
jgi:thiol-disulfide isomerase/thioredoxin